MRVTETRMAKKTGGIYAGLFYLCFVRGLSAVLKSVFGCSGDRGQNETETRDICQINIVN